MGINTENPQGTLHIKTSTSVSNTETTNDVLVKDGNVAIGHNTPVTKLDIKTTTKAGGFKMVDGTQSNGYVLTSDANGIGTWQPIGVAIYNVPFTSPVWILEKSYAVANKAKKTNIKVTLPPGKYLFTLGLIFQVTPSSGFNQSTNPRGDVLIRARFVEDGDPDGNGDVNTVDRYYLQRNSSGTLTILPRYVSTSIYPNTTLGTMNGTLAVENDSNTSKTYYLYIDDVASYSASEVTRVVPEMLTFQLGWNESFLYYQKLNYHVHK